MKIIILLVGVVIGLVIGYLILRPWKKANVSIKVIGTVMIPCCEEETLKSLGKNLIIFVSEPGKGTSNYIYAVKGDTMSESSYGGFSSSTAKKVLWGASFKKTNERTCINCIIIPGEFVEGTLTGAYQIDDTSRFRPCLINVVLY